MDQSDCEEYPDIFKHTPAGASKDTQRRIEDENRRSGRLYAAVRHVLRSDFDFREAIPKEPRDFPGQLSVKDRAQFVGILGMILADNWEDPSNGKEIPSSDDILVQGGGKNDTFVIDRRFVDAIVDAVKEYTASSELFNNVFTFMREEAAAGLNTKPTQSTASD